MTGSKRGKKILQTVGVILLLFMAAILLIPLMEQDNVKPEVESAEWMKNLDDGLLLSDINLPGTHDSATEYCELGIFSKCQAKEIREQLDSGYRYLDIRLGVDMVCGEPVLKLVHGSTTCKTGASIFASTLYLDEVLSQCYQFFVANPSETVAFVVKYETGDLSVAEFEELLDSSIQEHEDYWYLSGSMPELGEARGKLVLMRRYDDVANLGERSGINVSWVEQNVLKDSMPAEEITDNGDNIMLVQDRFIYGKNDKWNAFVTGMENSLTRDEGIIAINFLSTKGTLPVGHPYYFASRLNQALMSYDMDKTSTGYNYGWIVVDFGSNKVAKKIYETNF